MTDVIVFGTFWLYIYTRIKNQKNNAMYVANKINGIGRVTEETDTKVTVYFEDTDTEKQLLKKFVSTYATREEADAALNESSHTEITAKEEAENIDTMASERLAEINRRNAYKNRPSWMRDI